MRVVVRCLPLIVSLLLGACVRPGPSVLPSDLVLPGSDGKGHRISEEVAKSRLTVFVFYASHCPTLVAHEARLKDWAQKYDASEVRFFAVNSEVGATPKSDAAQARAREYPFVLLTDNGAQLARGLGAEFATHAVIVDELGRVKYSGGLDSDRVRLHDDAKLYLDVSIGDLLEGRPARYDGVEAMGCILQLR